MKKYILSISSISIISTFCFTLFTSSVFTQSKTTTIKGQIKNFEKENLKIYKCYADTLLFIDSIATSPKGDFTFQLPIDQKGLYNIQMRENQGFYIINDGQPIELKTVFTPNKEYNSAADSLVVLKSNENKNFFEFQRLQIKINIANGWLIQILRLYPEGDPFHPKVEKEYLERFAAMEELINKMNKEDKKSGVRSFTSYLTGAYYPFHPDWQQSNAWRDSVYAAHYFDYFNPSDEFYLNTNILTEKLEVYLAQRAHKIDPEGKDYEDKSLVVAAAKEFLRRSKDNEDVLAFALNHVFKRLNKERLEDDFIDIYDNYLKSLDDDCGEPLSTEIDEYDSNMDKLRKKWFPRVDAIRGVQIGHIAPDFTINDTLQFYDINSEYTLLTFWSTWCPFCVEEVPKVNKILQKYPNTIKALAFSLDTDKETWQNFIAEKDLHSFLHFSEFKSWRSDLVNLFNVHGTPTIFLFGKDKTILGKFINEVELSEYLDKNVKK